MAKAVSTGLKSHISGGATTLNTLWKVTRRDGKVFAFTDADVDIVYQGTTFLAATGFTPSAIDSSAGLNVDNMEIEGVISSETITDEDLLSGLWDFARIDVLRVNRRDLAQGHLFLRKGTIGEVSVGRKSYVAELRGLQQPMQQPIGNIYTSSCRADFGDARCKMDMTDKTVTGTITAVTDKRTFSDTGRTELVPYFTNGKLTFTSGLNNGRSMEVKLFTVGGTFQMHEAFPFDVSIGDTYIATWGCDKQIATCIARGNVINFRGFPYIPGKDKLLGV